MCVLTLFSICAKVYVRDCTPAPPLALVLFCGGDVQEDATYKGVLTIDNWLRLEVPPQYVAMLLEIRRRLARVLARMVERSDGGGGGSDALHLVDAVIELLRQPAEPELDLPLNSQGAAGGKWKEKNKKKKTKKKSNVLAYSYNTQGNSGDWSSMGADW